MQTFIYATRKHWNIECGLHCRLDVVVDENHSRNRTGNSINNLSIIHKIIFKKLHFINPWLTYLLLNKK